MGKFTEVRFSKNQSNAKAQRIPTEAVKKCLRILKERRSRLFILFIIFSIVVPLTTYYYIIPEVNNVSDKLHTCVIDPSYRVPCGLRNKSCSISCCFEPSTNECYHKIPATYNYKKVDELSYMPTLPKTPIQTNSIERLKLIIRDIDANRTQIILQDHESPDMANEIIEKNYVIKKDSTLLGVEVFRKTSMEMLLTTFRGPLIASNGYWEWSFQLTNEHLIGLGEIVFKNNETVTKVIYRNNNDDNIHPTFLAYSNGSFHGVVIEHQGLLEISVLPSKLVTLKSLTGSKIILNLCVGGKTPGDVVNQLKSYRPSSIPYWILGAHICRDGFTSIEDAIEEYKKFLATENKIHYSSDCIHENLQFMLNGTTEVNDELKKLIQELQVGSHFLLSVTPHVQAGYLQDKAKELGILYKYNNNLLKGSYLGHNVTYPDFTHKSINVWMKELRASFPADKIDGFVLRNNWPLNEEYQFTNITGFPYLSKEITASLGKTIPEDAYSDSEVPPAKHILKHNQYGAAQAIAFKNNFEYEFLITASHDYNIPDAVLIQNLTISWQSFKKTISTTLYHSVLGNPLTSIPICGSTKDYNKYLNEELCIRWYILAATVPLFRISSELPRRDPSSLATKYAYNIAAEALQKRFLLLPYYYTNLNLYNILLKPMFYDFYSDREVWNLEEQYMLGNALLVAHPVLAHTSKLPIYLPLNTGIWYEFWGGKKYEAQGWLTVDIVESDWIMFIRHGHIVPLRKAKQSAKIGSYSSDDTYTFAIALNCIKMEECTSEGRLLLTTESLELSANHKIIKIANVILAKKDIGCNSPQHIWPHIIDRIMVYGINNDTVVYSNFAPIDICESDLDVISIEYYKSI